MMEVGFFLQKDEVFQMCNMIQGTQFTAEYTPAFYMF